VVPHLWLGQVFQLLTKRLGVMMRKTSSYHPQTNGGLVGLERAHRSMKQLLLQVVERTGTSWPDALPLVAMLMNSAVHSSTGVSPNFVLFGRDVSMPLDVMVLPAEIADLDAKEHGLEVVQRMKTTYAAVQEQQLKSASRNGRRVNQDRVPFEAEVGDFVFVNLHRVVNCGCKG